VPLDTPWPDPWVTFAHLGAVTKKLHFASNIYLAALRDPFTAAKAIATASALTNGRIVCGVSAGWLEEEYRIVGVDFASRGRRLDEMLAVMRKLWSGQVVQHEGEFFRFEGIQAPAPSGHVRIWCGGDKPPAMRRAARHDGWLPLPMTVDQALASVARLRALRVEAGLPPAGLDVGLALAEPVTQAGVDRLRADGLSDIVVIAPWLPSPWDPKAWIEPGDDMGQLSVKTRALERYAAAVIHRIH
jgi:alkanesulfonate monooxygenase SsuD/methylene tetrahydromethanopterin reductase-like flavin-dependent oxidoreductase (luciferase family)